MANRKSRIAKEIAFAEKEQSVKENFSKRKQDDKTTLRPLLDVLLTAKKFNDFNLVKSKYRADKLKYIFRQKRTLRNYFPKRYAVFIEILQHPKFLFPYLYHYERLCKIFFQLEIYRNLDTWKMPKSKNKAVVFKSLVMHLFVKYRIPKCIQQDIYNFSFEYSYPKIDEVSAELIFHMIEGKGIHRFDKLDFGLNSKVNFHFHHAPQRYNTKESIMWARFRGKGLSSFLANKMLDNVYSYCCSYDYELVWEKWYDDFIFFINRTPDIPQKELNLIFDFVIYQRVKTKKINIPNYEEEITIGALYPEFIFKGRTLRSVMKFVDKWNAYVNLAKDMGLVGEFETSPIKPYTTNFYKNQIRFRQIKTLKGLALEGNKMSHCVATYGGECVNGESSIWSVREFFPEGKVKNLLTIEIDEKEKKILQVRGKSNRIAKAHEKAWIKIWCEKEEVAYFEDKD